MDICKHDRLARFCKECEMEQENATLRKQLGLAVALAKSAKELDEFLDLVGTDPYYSDIKRPIMERLKQTLAAVDSDPALAAMVERGGV